MELTKNWTETFPNYKVCLQNANVHSSWHEIFERIFESEELKKVEDFLSFSLTKTDGKVNMYPYPENVFSAFWYTSLTDLKVVIIGQDPYHNNEQHDDKIIPQAMGMSFSVPNGISIPSSLKNIYKNLLDYEHINEIPDHGNLSFWACQGVLMLNTSLTVQHGYPNSHASKWVSITDSIIQYISDTKSNIIFVLWGSPALKKSTIIDSDKHKIIVSSHPSGLSCYKNLGYHPSFMNRDHFKEINEYLEQNNKQKIMWIL